MKHKRDRKERDSFSRTKARHLVTVWGFFVLAVIAGIITMDAYIGNSREAIKRYETLLTVDQAGGDVEGALYSLRTYMYAHMNTQIGSATGIKPPIQLKGTYDRLVAAERARVESAKASNASLYTRAAQECERLIPSGLSGRYRIECVTEFVTKNALSEKENPIPEALYKFDFVSPVWSADTAGIGMVCTAIFSLIFAVRWLTYRRALHHLRQAS